MINWFIVQLNLIRTDEEIQEICSDATLGLDVPVEAQLSVADDYTVRPPEGDVSLNELRDQIEPHDELAKRQPSLMIKDVIDHLRSDWAI